MKTNLHTHSHFCDGAATPLSMAEAAARQGYVSLGFSSHAPVPFPSSWNMREEKLNPYRAAVISLRQQTESPQILLGLEADFIPGVTRPADWRVRVPELDYLIGSVHYLGVLDDGTPWTVDHTPEQFRTGVDADFAGDTVAAVVAYFRRVAEMSEADRPEIIGHCDLVKLFPLRENPGLRDDPRWHHAEGEMLDAVAASGSVLELNVKYITRGVLAEACPSDRILAAACRREIPVTVGADAHCPAELDLDWSGAVELLARAGYRERYVLDVDGWRSVAL